MYGSEWQTALHSESPMVSPKDWVYEMMSPMVSPKVLRSVMVYDSVLHLEWHWVLPMKWHLELN